MDKISAACAMEWSIQLDKALRSNNPARAVEAILQTGSRLEQWRQEPEATKAVCSFFGLVPGEDRLFANTILLRLADAFHFGDRNIRLSVVRIFLRSKKNRNRNKKQKRATFLNGRVHNHGQLLRRVKAVYDTGDVESRALSLVLFGCWADFAKDSAEIRYLVLSGMVSSHLLEVKASLFAAGCFCELANDFASVVLEMLVNMMASAETPPAIRLAGASVFTRMVCSYSVSSRAYKTGVQLVSDLSEQSFIIAMLVSLSKLVSKSTALISEHVDLLLSCLSQENPWPLRRTALRCLHLIFVKEGCCSPVNVHLIQILFSIVEEPELPSVMHCGALRIVHKVFLYTLSNLPSFEMLAFAQLLAILENASQSPIMSKSLAALRVLTDLSTKLWAITEKESVAISSSPLPSRVISLIMDRLCSLLKPFPDPHQTNSNLFQEVKSLLNLVLQLVQEHPDLGAMVLDEISSFIEDFANLNENFVVNFAGEKCKDFRSKVLSIILKFGASCLQNLNEAGAISSTVFDKVKLLVEHVQHGRVFDCHTHTIYSLLLHSCLVGNIGIFPIDHPFKHELHILEHTNKMLLERDVWQAYKAGINAACQGAWITAASVFAQLMTRVQSDSCYCWLKSLVHFSRSEAKIQLSLVAKQQSILVGSLDMNELLAPLKDNSGEVGQDAEGNNSELDFRGVLITACNTLSSSIQTLETVVKSREEFRFQIWFWTLRAKFLGIAGEILEVLDTLKEENVSMSNSIEVWESTLANFKHLERITQLSLRLKRLAKELDLMSSSFIGIDSKSSKIIAALALNCSALAFTAGFPLFFPDVLAYKNLRISDCEGSKQSYLCSMLLQDLLGRLCHLDHEISINLSLLLDNGGHPEKCLHLQSRNQILKSGHEVRHLLDIIRYAVSTMVHLRSETGRMQNESIVSHVTNKGTELLLDITNKCLQIPFKIPKHFFKIRPLIGSELFVLNTDSRNQNEITVLPDSHLSLDLCLQLRNTPPEFPLGLTKFYCLLHCRLSFQKQSDSERKQMEETDCQPWESEDMVDMYEKLFRYVTERAKETSCDKRFRDDDDINGDGIVDGFVCFEGNGRGQGFSNCVFDVSHFPVGCYRVKWYSCCVDNQGCHLNLLPLNSGPVFRVQNSYVV